MRISTIIAALLMPLAAYAASIEPGSWEFTVDMKAQGLGAFQPKPGPKSSTRCITPEQASNPAKVMSEVAARGECQFSNQRDTGSELSFDVRCAGRVPLQGSGAVRYNAQSFDGDLNLDGYVQGMEFTTRSHVNARRLGPCSS